VTGTSYGLPKWEFGDGNTSPLKEVCNVYAKPGEYNVVLKNLTQVCPWADTPITIKLNNEFPVFDNKSTEDCINSDYTLTLPEKAKNRPFVWLDLDGKLISTDANPKVNINSDTAFILNVKDDNGCAFNDTFSIKAFVYDVKLDAQDTVCTVGNYVITSTANQGINFGYTWSPSNAIVSGGNTSTPTVDVGKAQKFMAKLVHPTLGCEVTEEYNFNYFKYDYEIDEPKVYCLNGEAQPVIKVKGNVNYIYDWSPKANIISGGNTNKPTFDIDGKFEIKVKVTHPTLGCILRDSFPITPFEPEVSVKAEPNTTVPKNSPVDVSIIDPKSGWKYEWSNGFVGTTQKVVINSDTIFTIIATDENGCTAETEIRLDNRPPICEEDVFLPTAFSPNGDGNNDIFYIRSNYITDVELIIYNRWNQEVFTTKDINLGWDGRFNGEELAPDVYAYWYKAKCTDGVEIIKKGNVSLLR
jgi:gliding motility-associated-like protein